jgi:hypothetical protein
MESRTSSRSGTSRTRSTRSAGRASDDAVGGGEDLGVEFGNAESTGTTEASRTSQRAGASGLVEKMKEGATSRLSAQKDRATEGIGTLAQAVRETTERLRSEDHATVAQYVERAAEQLERLSTGLREKDVNELLQDAQRLAQRQPALFIGGSFAIGLLAARFLKSSREGDTSSSGYGDYGSAAPAEGAHPRGEW